MDCYSNAVFGCAYLILGLIAVFYFGKLLLEKMSGEIKTLCGFWFIIGIAWMCLGMWRLCEQIDYNSKPENVLKQMEYHKPDCMKFYTEQNAPISCLQEYTAWKVKYDKQKNYIDSLRQANIKILNEK